MAGKLGLAAKIFLGTTVLTGGGAGTWYATSQLPSLDAMSPAPLLAEDGRPISSQTADESASDLDAVASAWDEPATTSTKSDGTTKIDSSPIARSAHVPAASKTNAAPAGDRYSLAAIPVETEITTDDAAPSESETATEPEKTATTEPTPSTDEPTPTPTVAAAESEESQPTPEIASEVVSDEKPAATESATADTPAPSVARGQEPSEETELQALTGDAVGSDLQPLSTSNSKSDATARTDQAREAFRDAPRAASGGRYGAASAERNSDPAAGSSKQGLVNPFNTGGATVAAPTPAEQPITPLPNTPPNSAGGLTELAPNGDAQPLRPNSEIARIPERADTFGAPRGNRMRENSMPQGGSTLPSNQLGGLLPSGSDQPQNAALAASAGPEGAGRPGEKALEGPQRPSLEIQKFAPGEIQVGKPAKFVVRVRNVGTQAAEGVAIQDVVPQGTKLISTTPESQNSGGNLVWDLGKLSPGEDRTVEMQVMPVTEGEIGSVATVSYSAQASVKTKCTMPQLAIRMTAPAKVMIGHEQRVKIELRNPGTGDATGVMLFENVPQNVKHAAGPALEFDIGTLKAGETRELELVLMAEKAGKTVNVLSARADGNLQVQQQVEFEVIAPALNVDVEGPERRYLERPATYEVRVDNPGTAPAHNVQIVTKLPKGLRFVRANNKGEYDASTHAVYWSLAELPEGESGSVELVAMPIESGPQTLQVESRAGQGLADQAQQQIVIDGIAAIMFEVKDLEDPIEVGGETGYEIRVVNQGTKAATNVQVAVNLPPGMQLVSAEGETPHANKGGAVMFEPLAQLAAKSDTVYRLRVQGTAAGDQRVTVQVNTDDLAQPIRREESTLVFGDE